MQSDLKYEHFLSCSFKLNGIKRFVSIKFIYLGNVEGLGISTSLFVEDRRTILQRPTIVSKSCV